MLSLFLNADVQLGHMPSAEQIKGVREFSSTSATDDCGVAALFGQLGDKVTPDNTVKGIAMVTTGPGLATLPKNLAERILSRQYLQACLQQGDVPTQLLVWMTATLLWSEPKTSVGEEN